MKHLLVICVLIVISHLTHGKKMMVGGRRRMDLTDATIYDKLKQHTNYALEHITRERSTNLRTEAKLKLIRILKAESQLVAGINYFIKIRMSDADCLEQGECPMETCNLQIYERVWENSTQLTKYECATTRSRSMPLLGGIQRASVESESIKNALKYAVSELNRLSTSKLYQKLLKINSAKQQVVSGFNYFIEFELKETNCSRESGVASGEEECKHKEDGSIAKCKVTIWERPWLSEPYQVTNSDCA